MRDPDTGCAVLFVDIDRFKLVNDSLSHAVGDQLLVTLATRLASALRLGDTVARIGGDEFTVLLDGVTSPERAAHAAERLQQAIGETVEVDGHELCVTASIGIARAGRRRALPDRLAPIIELRS